MNNSLLSRQECTDSVDIQQNGNNPIDRNRLAIIPRLNFTCNGRIASIRARVQRNNGMQYPSFQVWRPSSSVGSTIYSKIGEVQLQSTDQVTGGNNNRIANIVLTGNNTIEFQSGDVVGYYHPPNARYQIRNIPTDGYIQCVFDELPPPTSVNLDEANSNNNNLQPLIQFITGKCAFS